MKATLKGNKLTIEIDLRDTPTPSSTGSTMIAAYEQNNDTGVSIKGPDGKDHPLRVQVNANYKAK